MTTAVSLDCNGACLSPEIRTCGGSISDCLASLFTGSRAKPLLGVGTGIAIYGVDVDFQRAQIGCDLEFGAAVC